MESSRRKDTKEGDPRLTALASAVRRRRRSLGLRQADLAALAGSSQRFVHTAEAGKATLRLDKLLDLLEVLGLDLVVVPGHGTTRSPETERSDVGSPS